MLLLVEIGNMAEETKTHFTFSFFDAAHTDGYVASPNKEFKRIDSEFSPHQQGKRFFSDAEEDEDIVTKIHHWKQTHPNKSKTKAPQKRQDLFIEVVKKEPESSNAIPLASNDIQLNRLLDDYMLGEKGDQIMQKMEALTTDDPPSPVQNPKSHLQQNHFGDDQTNESPLDLDAMVSMGDFEKYIAEN
ncbi:hypothetical protein F441_16257 [Phytophthora nicotianae CJ01A1]|uniref:Uncharacterized protein n=5 Tax=Phytophthora nicotianae TaxID=4792 RepID=V9EFF9_PHYNI|nr:hypothetical protein F443_16428 [Phytophthora nicotianae P1569]ETK77845.1 hypothetical protein L915_15968 [Phytophthora nicotianae]ETO66515.1 hypothetical protein F444_16397 [Phytophthora nicotianae P1976]ETP07629.1 hypothetical protein F441_16257 [Phytophthora nicotianae CJ01A1]ETP35658.1 hypothetical protein F442_16272 [Phytophthora nicotianae P10297]